MSSFKPIPNQGVIVPMLGKLRAAFTIASPLSLAGKHEATLKVYMRVVNELLSADNHPFFNASKLASLQETLDETKQSHDTKELTWLIKQHLEEIYDDIIDKYCGLSGVTFDPIHKKIGRCIEVCQPLVRSGRYQEANSIYARVAEDVISNARSISDKAKTLLHAAISSCCQIDNQEATAELRQSLNYVYEEIRLPDIYRDTTDVNNRPKDSPGEHILLFGKPNLGNVLQYDFITYSDTLMGGNSEAEFVGWEAGENSAIFRGNISVVNDGGFAGVRFLPRDQPSFKQLMRNCKGLLINVKNVGPKTERFKVILPSQKNWRAFNWQCDFLLPVKSDSSQIYLPLTYFWPSMFGHILSNNGNVALDKVDAIGFLISKITENGKPSPEFGEGEFAVQIESIYAVRA